MFFMVLGLLYLRSFLKPLIKGCYCHGLSRNEDSKQRSILPNRLVIGGAVGGRNQGGALVEGLGDTQK